MSQNFGVFLIGHITVKDADKWAEYRGKVPATLAPWGAELVCRGKRLSILSGEHLHADAVVIRFPDPTAVTNWFNSPSYQALIPLREQAAQMVLISYAADSENCTLPPGQPERRVAERCSRRGILPCAG